MAYLFFIYISITKPKLWNWNRVYLYDESERSDEFYGLWNRLELPMEWVKPIKINIFIQYTELNKKR